MKRYQSIKEAENAYDKILEVLKQAIGKTSKTIKKNKWGADKYPGVLYTTTKDLVHKNFPKMFTDKQIYRAVFNDKHRTTWDQADYLEKLYNKKIGK